MDRFERNAAEGVDGAAYGPKSHPNFLMVLRSRRCPATLTSGATGTTDEDRSGESQEESDDDDARSRSSSISKTVSDPYVYAFCQRVLSGGLQHNHENIKTNGISACQREQGQNKNIETSRNEYSILHT